MRIFSKLVFICNLCFLITIVMRYIEIASGAAKKSEAIIRMAPLQYGLVILGYGAILLNLFFVIIVIIRLLSKKLSSLPQFITIFNVVLFFVQLWYFFIFL